jgi:UDP-3-O-acyl-N-acetylglucosamine deacetylase
LETGVRRAVMVTRRYLDKRGDLLYVGTGIGGDSFMTMRGGHRVKSPALPLRKSFVAAQKDLNAYAASHGLPETPDGEKEE